MLMQEFVSRFASKNESSPLFEILRRVSRLDTRALLSVDQFGWQEWPPIDDPGDPGVARVAEA